MMTQEQAVTKEHIAQEVMSFVRQRPEKIANDLQLEQATGWLAMVRKRRKEMEDFFNKRLKRHRDAIRDEQKENQAILAPIIQEEKSVDTEILNYRTAQRRKADEEQRKKDEQYQKRVEKAADQGKDPTLVKPPPVVQQPAKTVGTTEGEKVTFRQIPKFKVIDPALVPKEFWKIDETEIGKQVRAGRRDIPGVHVWMEESSSVR